ncbi:MAG TPA: amidohydrolase family protein [Nevskiaceae bacterium]|nr:amidohydrolase family protein [Nevskiaceae bacterium]
MIRPLTLLSLALCLLAPPAWSLSIDCGRVLDVQTGRWLERQTLSVAEGRIRAIDPWPASFEGERIDLRELSCLPGLIDLHVHLTSETAPQAEAFREALQGGAVDAAYESVPWARRTLEAGFTTVRDLGSSEGLGVALKRAIAAGHVVGPRMMVSGKSIATTGGHADPTNSLGPRLARALGVPGPIDGVIDSPEQARQAVRARYKEGADLIKITATGGVLSQAASGQNAQFTEAELAAIVSTARDYGFKVAAHAHGAEGMKRALRAGVDTIEHGTFMDEETLQLFRKTGAWYVPTVSAGKFVGEKSRDPHYYSPIVRPKAAAVGPQIQSTLARAWKAGVKIAFGTDAGVFPHGENAREFVYMVEAGMPPLEALRAATLHAAEALGQAQTLGRLAPGYAADLVAVEGDPLADIARLQAPRAVIQGGRRVR